MRIVYLIPTRGLADPNTAMVSETLVAAGHSVRVVGASRWPTAVGKVLELRRTASRMRFDATGRPDAVLCRDLDTLEAGSRLADRTGAKLVYWAHDVYPWMVESDVPRFVYDYLVKYERRWFPTADAVIVANPGIARWLKEQSPRDGIGYDPGFNLVLLCRDPQPTWVPPEEPRTLLYAGTLHKNRFTKEMVLAMDEIDARLIVAAPQTNNLYEWVRDNAGPNVEFYGTVSPEVVWELTRRAGVVVTMLNPEDKCLRVGLANKLFDAMSVGRAAIGTKGTATGDLIVENQTGFVVDYNVGSYIEGVNALLSYDMSVPGYNAYNACVSRFNWKTEAAKLVGVFDSL